MKKSVTILFAMLVAGVLVGEELNIKGDFKEWNPAGNAPLGWFAASKNVKCNAFPSETKEGNSFAQVQAGKEEAVLCSREMVPVKPGDIITVTVELKGNGTAGAKLFLYDGSRKYIGTLSNGFYAREQLRVGKWKFRIDPEYGKEKKMAPAFCRIAFFAGRNSDVLFRKISAELQRQQNQ